MSDDAEVNIRETLQFKEDFITQTARPNDSCVLEAGFVPLEVVWQRQEHKTHF